MSSDASRRAGRWCVRRHPATPTSIQGGSGDMVIDFEFPEPEPTPLTTIAWRLGHIIVGVLGARTNAHFDGPPADYMTWEYAATAQEALAQFDAGYDRSDHGRPLLEHGGPPGRCGGGGRAVGRVLPRHPRRPHQSRAHPPPRRDRAAAGPLGAPRLRGEG